MTSLPGQEQQLRLVLTVENILRALSAGNLKASTRRPRAACLESKYLICTDFGVDQASAEGADDRVLSHESESTLDPGKDGRHVFFDVIQVRFFVFKVKPKQNRTAN